MAERHTTATLTNTLHLDRRQVLRRALSIGLISCILLAVPFHLHYVHEVRRASDFADARGEWIVTLAAQTITHTIESIISDLQYLSDQNELKDLLAADSPLHRERLAQEYVAFLTQKPGYDQVRLISAEGWEQIRVDRRQGHVAATPEDRLQNKGDRHYFAETMKRGPRGIYISPLDLNIENGRIEEPRKPTLRVSLPLFDAAGGSRGILAINYLAGRLLDRLRAILPTAEGELWLLNLQGYWILGQAADEWAFMYPDRADRTLAARDASTWQRLIGVPGGRIALATGSLAFRTVCPLFPAGDRLGEVPPPSAPTDGDDYCWIVAAKLHPPLKPLGAANLARNLALLYAALALLLFGFASTIAFVSLKSRALKRFVEHVLDHVPALIAYVDPYERYRYNNRHYQSVFGLNPKDLSGKSIRSVLGQATYRQLRPHLGAAFAGRLVSFEVAVPMGNQGKRDLAVTYTPDVDEAGLVRGLIVVAADVTELKAAERRDRERMLEFAQAMRLASVGEMATQIAHEVNQPLTAIVTYCAAAQHALQQGSASTRLVDLLSTIAGEARRAGDIVRRLRAFARRDGIAFATVDVNEIVVEVLHAVGADTASRDVQIRDDRAREPLLVNADRVPLAHALQNLLRNAVEAAASVAEGPRVVTVTTRRSGQVVELQVDDTGPGVAPETAAQLFRSFVTTKPGGLGMGLAIARSIVEAHGGQLTLADTHGSGAGFVISLPGERQ
jgi:PAS domain S-box-containing protein